MRRTVKDLLSASKDSTELMLDLAFASVFLDEEKLAREVLRLEDRMDHAVRELRILCMLATRSPEDAEQLSGVLGLVNAIEEIADAAEDIARVTLRELGVPPALRDDLRYADEVTARVKIRDDSALAGRTLRDIGLPSETGMWVIAIRREVEYEHGPSSDTTLLGGDVLFLQGPAEGVDLARHLAGASRLNLQAPPQPKKLSDLDRAVDILIEMKNAAEAAVGLAYSAVLFDDTGLASEVSGIEDLCDGLYHDLQRWVLRAARELPDDDDLDGLRALISIGQSAESIADAAQEMTRLAESPEETHPVIRAALINTEERVDDAVVQASSDMVGKTLRELKLRTATGADVLALKRGGRWINKPKATRRLEDGDRLVVLAPEEGIERLREWAGDSREVEDGDE
ncbi:potassium channel family protein [Euzebya tangerina]|uniref:potassium channel family protein n=1 Tax=Euzebya tangerina TaxID=591198 RepID=UPI000E31CCC0|nr:TrkA C-terminal domain-containing protein [Euzebya tangerina]